MIINKKYKSKFIVKLRSMNGKDEKNENGKKGGEVLSFGGLQSAFVLVIWGILRFVKDNNLKKQSGSLLKMS